MAKNIEKNIECNHYLIECDGYNVCYLCGCVKSEFTFYNDVTMKDTNSSNNEKYELSDELFSKDIISLNVLKDVKNFVEQWKTEKIPYKHFHEIYAIYYASKINNFPLTLKELSYFSGISIKNFCKVEKYLKKNILSSPFDFLEKHCKLLNLTFSDEKLVKTKIEEIEKVFSASPSIISAVAISLVFMQIDRKLIARATGSSTSAINKMVNEYTRGSAKKV